MNDAMRIFWQSKDRAQSPIDAMVLSAEGGESG
jgi:hypothetical protein